MWAVGGLARPILQACLLPAPTLGCFFHQPPLVSDQKQVPGAPSNSARKPKRHNGEGCARASPAGERVQGTRKGGDGAGGPGPHWKKPGRVRQEERNTDADTLMNPCPGTPILFLPAPPPGAHCPAPAPRPPSAKSASPISHGSCVHTHSQPPPPPPPRLHNLTLKCPQLPSNKGKTSPHPPWYKESSPFPLSLNYSPKLGAAANALSEQLHPHRHVLSPPRRPLFSSDAHLPFGFPSPTGSPLPQRCAWREPLTPTETNLPWQHPGAARSVPTPAPLPPR